MKKVQKATVKLIMGEPFIGAVLARLAVVYEPDAPAPSATDGKSIVWSDEFEDQPLPCITFTLAHEVMHVMSGHVQRAPAIIKKLHNKVKNKTATAEDMQELKRHSKAWNMATDVKINTHLDQSQAKRVGIIKAPVGFPLITAGSLDMAPQEVMTQTEEAIYQAILKAPPSNAPAHYDGPGDLLEADDEALTEADVAVAVHQANLMAKGGIKNGAIGAALVETITTTTVDYRRVLADVLTSTSGGDRTWSRRSRRSEDIIMPGRRSQKLDALTIVVDVSASTRSVIPQFLDQVQQLIATLPVDKLRVIQHNTSVRDVMESSDSTDVTTTIDKVRDNLKSGGGTRFVPVVEDLKQHEPSAAVVWLTDGASADGCPTDIPTQSLIWAVPEKALNYARGRLTTGTICSFTEAPC